MRAHIKEAVQSTCTLRDLGREKSAHYLSQRWHPVYLAVWSSVVRSTHSRITQWHCDINDLYQSPSFSFISLIGPITSEDQGLPQYVQKQIGCQ